MTLAEVVAAHRALHPPVDYCETCKLLDRLEADPEFKLPERIKALAKKYETPSACSDRSGLPHPCYDPATGKVLSRVHGPTEWATEEYSRPTPSSVARRLREILGAK